jgi:acetyltransferase-like isoleucine patch superfamily enzyme
MKITNKIVRNIRKIVELDFIKTSYYRCRLNLKKGASFHIYPNSIIKISKTANFQIENGKFSVNASWFAGRKRRYQSELRLDDKSALICNGKFSLYQGASVYVAPNATLKISGNAFLNTNSTLNCFHRIEIGNGVCISDNVEIQDSDNHFINEQKGEMSAPIVIEDNVWIGKNVIILKGVTIGHNSVIGAGAVVTKNVPNHSVAAGNPAKVIKTIESWE